MAMYMTFVTVETIARDRRDARLEEAEAHRRMRAGRNAERELGERRLLTWVASRLRPVRATA